MSTGYELEIPVTYVRWKINTYNATSDTKWSSYFRFDCGEWRLGFNSYPTLYNYLWLQKKRSGFQAPFVIWVHVEHSGTGRIATGLSNKTRCENDQVDLLIWQESNDAICRVDTAFRQRHHDLRLLLVIKKEDSLTDTDSKATQAEGHLPEVDPPSSKSVQTILLHNMTPCLESLSEDFARLMDQGSDPNVEFQCADQSTRAHRSIVCARSKVISSMLSSDMVEGRKGVVKIPNMEPDVFKKFLRYIYCGRLDELTFDTALALYEAGDQYSVLGLARRCSQYLTEHLSVDNACEALVAADAHSDRDLVEEVIDYIMKNNVPRASDQWSAFSDHHPKLAIEILNRGWDMLDKSQLLTKTT